MTRKSSTSVRVDPDVRCPRVYPVQGTAKSVTELKTVGLKMDRDQAVHLARVLLAVAQDWEEIEIAAYRGDKRKLDGTYHVTVTSDHPVDA